MLSDLLLLLVVIRQGVDEFVEVGVDVVLFQELSVGEVAILDLGVDLVVGGVVGVVAHEAVAGVFVE